MRMPGGYGRRTVLAMLAAGALGAAAPAQAQEDTILPQIVRQLEEQGFTVERVRRTWLGRVQVVARSARHRREIVYAPATGEVLRDYWRKLDDGGGRDDRRSRDSSGRDDRDDRDTDDDSGDDGDDDRDDDSRDDGDDHGDDHGDDDGADESDD